MIALDARRKKPEAQPVAAHNAPAAVRLHLTTSDTFRERIASLIRALEARKAIRA